MVVVMVPPEAGVKTLAVETVAPPAPVTTTPLPPLPPVTARSPSALLAMVGMICVSEGYLLAVSGVPSEARTVAVPGFRGTAPSFSDWPGASFG